MDPLLNFVRPTERLQQVLIWAAIFMGLALANQRGFDIPARCPFFETFVQLIIGVPFFPSRPL